MGLRPREPDDLRDGRSFAGMPDCGGQNVFHGKYAKPFVQRKPPVYGARNRDGQRPMQRNPVGSVQARHKVFPRLSEGRSSAGVQPMQATRRFVPYDGEQVSADSAVVRLDEAQHGVGGDGGVHGRAALFQDVDGGLRSQRMAGRSHAMLAHRRTARGEGRSGQAVSPPRRRRALVGNGLASRLPQERRKDKEHESKGPAHGFIPCNGTRSAPWKGRTEKFRYLPGPRE